MAQKQDIRTQLLTASPFQLMLSLSVPASIGMVVVRTRIPLTRSGATGTGSVLNIILDPIMTTAMSVQGQGIEGAAYATVASQIITAVITLWYFVAKSSLYSWDSAGSRSDL